LVLGTPAKNVMAELYGRITGTSKGKGGSMHYFDKERNLFGGHGIVGGQIGLGAGIAFADKYRGGDQVTLCMMGDGAPPRHPARDLQHGHELEAAGDLHHREQQLRHGHQRGTHQQRA
jgi:hypothetical protein